VNILEFIYEGIRLNNQERDLAIPCEPETPLYGPEADVDSLGLVTILAQVEMRLAEHGHNVNLADDGAVEEVPWRTVTTLREYIERRLG
jgi:hypothetical protein